MDIVERLIAYRDREGRSDGGRDLLADAANEIVFLRRELGRLYVMLQAAQSPGEDKPP
jgi:hypothetical protein